MKVAVVYYSLYGHVLQLARAVAEGVESVEGVEVLLRRVSEFDAVERFIESNEAARKVREDQREIPVCTLDDLRTADALILGSPTRFGNMAAQVKQFLDSASSLWMEGALEGKPAGLFTSTASSHGGQEVTLLTMMPPLLHLGMIIVGIPYSTPGMLHTEARGGTPYGASTIAGPKGELSPAAEDLQIAKVLGQRVAVLAKKIRS